MPIAATTSSNTDVVVTTPCSDSVDEKKRACRNNGGLTQVNGAAVDELPSPM